MGMTDNGGPAFPCDAEWRDGQEVWPQSAGMTLHDWFAGQALMSLPHLCAHDTLTNGDTFEMHVARNAYALADAMIAARKGGDA